MALTRCLGSFLVCCGAARALAAQQPASPAVAPPPADSAQRAVATAAASITAADLAQDWQILASDSMNGPAPSPALDRTARYLMARLQSLGLSPKDQRYPVPNQVRVDYATTTIRFWTRLHDGESEIVPERGFVPTRIETVSFATAARFLGPTMPLDLRGRSFGAYRTSVLLAGPHTAASLRTVDVQNKTVLYVPPKGGDTAARNAVLRDLAAQSAGIVIVGPSDSAAFAAAVQAAATHPPYLAADYLPEASEAWVAEVAPGALRETLRTNALDLAALRAASVPLSQPLPFLSVGLAPKAAAAPDVAQAPNVVTLLDGSDPQWQDEALVLVAPMDRRGAAARADAMSVAGLLALAKAFSQPGARPRRSLLFVATSGGDEFWGSRYFLSQLRPRREVVPRLVVTLALGSRLASDSMTVAGLEEVDLAPSPVWTAALHAELGVAVVDTGSVLAPTAEASVFADRWLPVLAVQAGRPVASPDGGRLVSPDAAAAARVLQLLFYTIHALANDDRTPAWTPAARQQIAPPLP